MTSLFLMTRFLKSHEAFNRKQVRAHRGAYTQKVPPAPGAGAGGSVSRQGCYRLGGGVHDRWWKCELLLIEVAARLPISKTRIMQRLRLGEARVRAPLKEGRRHAGGRRWARNLRSYNSRGAQVVNRKPKYHRLKQM